MRACNVACQPAAACRISAQSSIIRVMAAEVAPLRVAECRPRSAEITSESSLLHAFSIEPSRLVAASHALAVLSDLTAALPDEEIAGS